MPAKTLPRLDRKILYHAIDSGATGSQRILRPLELLTARGAVIEQLNKNIITDQLKDADLVVLQCLVGPEELDLVKQIKASKAKLVIDYDDNFQALPFVVRNRIPHSQETIAHTWAQYLQLADLVTVTCYQLFDVVWNYTKKVFVLPNYLLKKDIVAREFNPFADTSEIRILFSGSESHADDFKWICPVLKWLGEHYPQVRIISHGKLDFTYYCPTYKGKATHVLGCDYNFYYDVLQRLQPHIFIAPLNRNSYADCRSNLKYYQAGAVKAAFVCSDSPAYSNVAHGISGFMPAYRLTWWWYLRTLIRDPKFGRMLGENAYWDTVNNTLESHINRWVFAYESLIEDTPHATRHRQSYT